VAVRYLTTHGFLTTRPSRARRHTGPAALPLDKGPWVRYTPSPNPPKPLAYRLAAKSLIPSNRRFQPLRGGTHPSPGEHIT
jgi:hypothetical protein